MKDALDDFLNEYGRLSDEQFAKLMETPKAVERDRKKPTVWQAMVNGDLAADGITTCIRPGTHYERCQRWAKDYLFTCKGCGKSGLEISEVSGKDFHSLRCGNGTKSVNPFMPYPTVGIRASAMLVCSEACKWEFLKQNDHYFDDLMNEVSGLPVELKTFGEPPQPTTLTNLTNSLNAVHIGKLRKVAEGRTGFWFRGVPGCGKTSLAVAMGFEYRKRNLTVKFIDYADLKFALLAYKDVEERLTQHIYEYGRKPWNAVIVDDIEPSFPGQFGAERMQMLIQKWYSHRTRCIFTSNYDIETVGNAICPPLVKAGAEGDNAEPTAAMDSMVASRLKEMCLNFADELPEYDYRKEGLPD